MWLLTVGVGVSAAETDSSIDAAAMSEVNLMETMVASRCDGSRAGKLRMQRACLLYQQTWTIACQRGGCGPGCCGEVAPYGLRVQKLTHARPAGKERGGRASGRRSLLATREVVSSGAGRA